MSSVYLDWNATTPPHPDVLEAMREASATAWANPASVHEPGRRARAWVERAREAVARLVGLDARDVTLTSGGTEANNLALFHAFGPGGEALVDRSASAPSVRGRRRDEPAPPAVSRRRGVLLLSRLEHPSVVRAAEMLEQRGVALVWIEVGRAGRVEPEAVAAALEAAEKLGEPRLVALQAVNHETGVIQPVADVARVVHARGARLHVDAVQAAGRLSSDAWEGADLVAVAAHKMRGPKGVGALASRPGVKLRALLGGGAQEGGVRPGTQDAVACAGLSVAAERALDGPARYAGIAALRDALELALVELGRARGLEPQRNGEGARAPHVVNLSWPGWNGAELAAALDLEGLAVSSGSACSAGTAEPSPVIEAVAGRARAAGAVRISLGETTTTEDVRGALERWSRVLSRSR